MTGERLPRASTTALSGVRNGMNKSIHYYFSNVSAFYIQCLTLISICIQKFFPFCTDRLAILQSITQVSLNDTFWFYSSSVLCLWVKITLLRTPHHNYLQLYAIFLNKITFLLLFFQLLVYRIFSKINYLNKNCSQKAFKPCNSLEVTSQG